MESWYACNMAGREQVNLDLILYDFAVTLESSPLTQNILESRRGLIIFSLCPQGAFGFVRRAARDFPMTRRFPIWVSPLVCESDRVAYAGVGRDRPMIFQRSQALAINLRFRRSSIEFH